MIGQGVTPAHGQSKINRLMPERGYCVGPDPSRGSASTYDEPIAADPFTEFLQPVASWPTEAPTRHQLAATRQRPAARRPFPDHGKSAPRNPYPLEQRGLPPATQLLKRHHSLPEVVERPQVLRLLFRRSLRPVTGH